MDDEPVVAKSVTTHELYHAVQGAFASQRDAAGPANVTTPRLKACSDLKTLFANLYEEGTAEYVADPSTLSEARSAVGRRIWDDTLDGLKHVRASNSLLEMSVISISADHPPSYDDIYEVGFLGHGTLYTIAYVMATAIAEDRGRRVSPTCSLSPPTCSSCVTNSCRSMGRMITTQRWGPIRLRQRSCKPMAANNR